MALRKIHLHGSLGTDVIEMEGTNVAELITGLSRQHPSLAPDARGRKVIEIRGYETEESLYIDLGRRKNIHIYPALIGAKSKFTQILLGAALIAVSLMIPGSATGMLLTAKTMAFQMGAMMVLGGISQMLSPTPDINDSNERSYSFGGARNTVAIGTPIGILYGEFRCGGHYLSFDTNSSKTNIIS